MKIRHVILDRDGVLNREARDSGYVCKPDDFEWLPGALEGLAMLRGAGVHLSVVTNQSGVGRGLMTIEQLESVHDRMRADAAAEGVTFDAIFFCPHAPWADCSCRKPAPELIRCAMATSGIPAKASLVIGDDIRDLQAARSAGVMAVLVLTGKGRKVKNRVRELSVPVYDDLSAVAHAVLTGGILPMELSV
jgi:D-glycero-D-manno-heptose 1,7-bisphosphate phosphatase